MVELSVFEGMRGEITLVVFEPMLLGLKDFDKGLVYTCKCTGITLPKNLVWNKSLSGQSYSRLRISWREPIPKKSSSGAILVDIQAPSFPCG